MNNPGIDPVNWERLEKKWNGLLTAGHKLDLEYRLLSRKDDEETLLAIDVVQNVDEDMFTETVQQQADEGYALLGIAGLSMEEIVEIYKEKLKPIYRQAGSREASVIVTMSPTSPLSGEIKGYIEHPDLETKDSFRVNYQHYYLLNALRDKMVDVLGDGWHSVKAVYRYEEIEFYFDYGNGWSPSQSVHAHRPGDRRTDARFPQSISGIDPMVVQAVENLFPEVGTQKVAFTYVREAMTERKGVADPKTLLALLCYSKGDLGVFRNSAWQSHPHFWIDEISHIFRTMEEAEEWVKSISKARE